MADIAVLSICLVVNSYHH